jgi:hypothetical protein
MLCSHGFLTDIERGLTNDRPKDLPASSAMKAAKMLLENPDMSAIDFVRIEGRIRAPGFRLFQRKGSDLVLTENRPDSHASK